MLELPLLTTNSLHSPQLLVLAAQLKMYQRLPAYTNWLLGSCAINGQSFQIVMEDSMAQSAHPECHYTR